MNRIVVVATALVFWPVSSALADVGVEIDYQGLTVTYDPGGNFSLTHNTSSKADAMILGSGSVLDEADIFNQLAGFGSFQLDFAGTLLNGGGTNDISLTGLYRATDSVTTLANPSLAANFVAGGTGLDPDGVSYSRGILRIEGLLSPAAGNSSILVNPAGGPWVYVGKDDGAMGPGLDGVDNTITVDESSRNAFNQGLFAVLEINLDRFADGTLIGDVDADTLFANALAHGGFSSTSSQLQVSVVPAPPAVLLGLVGFGALGWFRKRLA